MTRNSYFRRFESIGKQALRWSVKSHTEHHKVFYNNCHHHGTLLLHRNHGAQPYRLHEGGSAGVKSLSYVRFQQPQQGVQIAERQSSR